MANSYSISSSPFLSKHYPKSCLPPGPRAPCLSEYQIVKQVSRISSWDTKYWPLMTRTLSVCVITTNYLKQLTWLILFSPLFLKGTILIHQSYRPADRPDDRMTRQTSQLTGQTHEQLKPTNQPNPPSRPTNPPTLHPAGTSPIQLIV